MTRPTALWFWNETPDVCRYPKCACYFLWCAGPPHPPCPLTGRALEPKLIAENADLRRWKALDKPLTAAMAIAVADMQQLRADNERLRAERDEARRREREWHLASCNDRAELHLLKQDRAALEHKP